MSDGKKGDIPIFDVGLIETHCHLDYLKQLSIQEIVEKSHAHNIEKIITIAVAPDNLDEVVAIANRFNHVYATQGIHPHEAKFFTQEVEATILKNLSQPKVVAVGEIGLDYHYNHSIAKTQVEVFERLLQIACDSNKPVVIHTRDADEDTMAVLKNFSSTLKSKGVIHSFTSSIELAEFCLSEGFHIGFNGIITFKNAQNVRDVLAITPIERILTETDAPFLTPIPHRGKENAPFYLPYIAMKIAEEKSIELDLVLKTTKQNASDLFRI